MSNKCQDCNRRPTACQCDRVTIDVTKPLELEDGTPVHFSSEDSLTWGRPKIGVVIEEGGDKVFRFFDSVTGKHVFGQYPRLRNVPPAASSPGEFSLVMAGEVTRPSLPDDATKRLEYPMAEGLLDYFPNALAEVARLSHVATAQHHPEKGMHWDRDKSTDHANKIMRHLVDRGKLDDKGMRHSAMVAWRALAMLQEELEEAEGFPLSRASRKEPAPEAVTIQ